ncbi:MAG: response regulator [Lachnospiraceae bacterium]|mgnify:CR=1 FL=1|nr:response regulator [Lachnospiraceae bacterium]
MQRILVVDDMATNRELLREILEDDYSIETAENGENALIRLEEYREELAAVLLDLQMPELDGFAVIDAMKKNGLLKKIPVLIISSEHAVQVESQCLELGVSDFIHKPFDGSIVRNRVKNTLELFAYKNRLEQTVEKQRKTLRHQDRIIQIQAERLKEAEPFDRLMMEYRFAIMEVETRLKVLNEEFSREYKRNPIESIRSRLKTPESIYDKMRRKGYPITVENIREQLTDVAGLRVICSFPDDIYRLAELFTRQGDILLLRKKDYIKNPKDNGYRSLHLILDVPIFLSNERKYMKAEIQFRTIAMDFWASLEHKLKYKKDLDNAEKIAEELRVCADSIEALDYEMQELRDKIDRNEKNYAAFDAGYQNRPVWPGISSLRGGGLSP